MVIAVVGLARLRLGGQVFGQVFHWHLLVSIGRLKVILI